MTFLDVAYVARVNVLIFVLIQGKIDNLQRELQMYRDALKKQVCHQCTHHHLVDRADDAVSKQFIILMKDFCNFVFIFAASIPDIRSRLFMQW